MINNTAEIHFDENPAIVTNTTYHTIFDCASFTGTTGDLEFCEGDNALLSAEQEYAETYTWSINDGAAGAGSTIHLGKLIAVVYNIGVYVENPLCGSTSEEILLVLENPTANDKLAVVLPCKNCAIKIYNALGQVVRIEQTVSSVIKNIDVSAFPAGS